MQLSLPIEVQKLIEERVNSGEYRSAEHVVTAAVFSLVQGESLGAFAPGELDALIEEGEQAIARGECMELDAAFAELRRRHELRRESKR